MLMPAVEQVFLSGIIGSNIVTLTTIKKKIIFIILFLICLSGEGFNPYIAGSIGFADGRHKVSPDSEGLSVVKLSSLKCSP